MEGNAWSLPAALDEVRSFRAAPPPKRSGVAIGFTALKGGSGATLVSSGAASLLGSALVGSQRVCYVSFDTSLYGVYSLLGPQVSLPEGPLTASVLEPLLEHRLDLGYSSLLLSSRILMSQQVAVLSLLRQMFDVVIADFPGAGVAFAPTSGVSSVLDRLVVVALPHLGTRSHLDVFQKTLTACGFDAEQVVVLLNQVICSFDSPAALPPDCLGILPDDEVWRLSSRERWSSLYGHSIALRQGSPQTRAALCSVLSELCAQVGVPLPKSSPQRSRVRLRLPFRSRRPLTLAAEAEALSEALVSHLRWDWSSEDPIALNRWLGSLPLPACEIASTLLRETGRVNLSELAVLMDAASILAEPAPVVGSSPVTGLPSPSLPASSRSRQ